MPQFSLEYILLKVNRQNPKITSSLKRFKTDWGRMHAGLSKILNFHEIVVGAMLVWDLVSIIFRYNCFTYSSSCPAAM